MKTKVNLNLEKIAVTLFYLYVLLEIIIVIIDKSNYTNPIEGQLFRLTFLLAALKLLLTRYSAKEWLAVLLLGLLGFVSYRMTGRNEILRIVVFIAACKHVDMKRALSFVFYTTLAGCLLLVLLSVTGIYGRLSLEADFGRGYVQTRYCLGLGHPNALHCMLLMLTALGLYLYNKRMQWYSYLLLFLLNGGLYLLTDSKTGMIMTLCTILGAVVVRYWRDVDGKAWIYLGAAAVFLGCVLLSVLLADSRVTRPANYWFDPAWVKTMDSHLNGRIKALFYDSINREGTTATWSLFSGPANDYFFDMGFIRLFYWYGILPGIAFVLSGVLLIRQLYRNRDGMGAVMISAFSIYTVVEAHLVSVYIGRNYLLFLTGMYMSGMLHLAGGREAYLWNGWRLLFKTGNGDL